MSELTLFAPENFEHAQRVAKMLSSSDLIPKEYRGNIQNTLIAMEVAARVGMSPTLVMQNLYIVHGKPSWGSQFIITAINNSKRFSPLRYKYNEDNTSCYAYATDLETKEVIKGTTITMAMAKAEGWIDKAGSKWKTMPEQMLAYRAAAFFGRLYAPEVMLGMYTEDEVRDITHTVIEENEELKRFKSFLSGCETTEEVGELVAGYRESVGEITEEIQSLIDEHLKELK